METNENNKKPPEQRESRKKHKIPVRKRFKRIKRHVAKPTPTTSTSEEMEGMGDTVYDDTSANTAGENAMEIAEQVRHSPNPVLSDHDYAGPFSPPLSRPGSSLSRPGSSLSRPGSRLSGIDSCLSISTPELSEDALLSDVSSSGLFSPLSDPQTPQKEPVADPYMEVLPPHLLQDLLMNVRSKLLLLLPQFFLPVVDNKGIHVLMVGRRESKAVQRDVFVSSSGSVRIEVHGQEYPAHSVLNGVIVQKPLCEENLGHFADRIVQIVNNLRLLEVCAGMDKAEFKEAWPVCVNGIVEADTYKECRYKETFRSKACSLLVLSKTWRCKECTKLPPFLKRKLDAMQEEEPHQYTNTRYLLDKQKDKRLASKQRTIKKQSLTIDRLQARMKELIAKEGMKVEKNLSDDLTEILQSANLSVAHSLFLQQQIKAISCKKSCGMRWHPTLIRLALSMYLKSPSAYKELSESGFVKLPSARTLFDYSHATRTEQGIDTTVLDSIAKQVATEELSRVQYHVLMADEIHISKNLVIQRSTGEIVGFTNLDDLDKELKVLDSYLDDPEKTVEPEVASKIMAFMVKGVSSKVKDVVASYPVNNPSPKQVYLWTWEVIGALERSDVKIIVFTCDGAPSNRAFLKLHEPVTVTNSGVIYDTVNIFAPHRTLYFFSDVPHLLKTIRNALHNSRLGKKGTRCLKKNGEPIVWDTIIRLYLSKKDMTLRKSYKLTAQSVFPDGYSKMKVSLAARVLSKTVANDILSQQWPQTTEIVDFILKTNNWFDLLNGAFSYQGKKSNNTRLDAYTKTDIEDFEKGVPTSRFQELFDYLQYLDEWREEIKAKKQLAAEMSVMSELGVQLLEEDVSFHALDESQHDDNEEDSNNLLPHQTLYGIAMSTRAFVDAVTFLINEGVSFVNARVFCQDPLEQNFGKQRMGGGGSSNPNVSQYYFKQRAISLVGQLAAAKRSSGNTEVINEGNDITSEPLPKRRVKRKDSL